MSKWYQLAYFNGVICISFKNHVVQKYYGAILPNAKIFGGVKRFLELGNNFINLGIDFVIFTPDGHAPEWFDYRGETRSFQEIGKYEFEALFITESQFIPLLLTSKSRRKIFYYVIARFQLREPLRHKEIEIFANSTTTFNLAKRYYRANPFKAYGGINTELFTRRQNTNSNLPFVIMAYGRIGRRRKGTMLVVRACERLYRQGYNIKLLLFDTPPDERSRKLIANFSSSVPFEFVLNHPVMKNSALFYRADVFVSAEKGGGWSNTAAEAAACGVPVIATRNGTSDFIIDGVTGLIVRRFSWSIQRAIVKIYNNPDLRNQYSIAARKKIEEFSWKNLAEKIVNHLEVNNPKP